MTPDEMVETLWRRLTELECHRFGGTVDGVCEPLDSSEWREADRHEEDDAADRVEEATS